MHTHTPHTALAAEAQLLKRYVENEDIVPTSHWGRWIVREQFLTVQHFPSPPRVPKETFWKKITGNHSDQSKSVPDLDTVVIQAPSGLCLVNWIIKSLQEWMHFFFAPRCLDVIAKGSPLCWQVALWDAYEAGNPWVTIPRKPEKVWKIITAYILGNLVLKAL